MVEFFPKLMTDNKQQTQKIQITPSRLNIKKPYLAYILLKFQINRDTENLEKSQRFKKTHF